MFDGLKTLTTRMFGAAKGFEAGQGNRRLRAFTPSRAHVNQMIEASGETVLARSRQLIRNNGYAANGSDAFVTHVIGSGIRPNPGDAFTPDSRAGALKVFHEWSAHADAEGLTDFYGLQARIAAELFAAGEVFVRFRSRRPADNVPLNFQLELLPAEMLDMSYSVQLSEGRTVRNGVEFDALGRRTGYHFWRHHPGDMAPLRAGAATGSQRVFVPARDVMHLIDSPTPGQVRGVSRLAPAIVKLHLLDAYDDAELERKRTTSLFVGFVTRAEGDPFEGDGDGEDTGILPLEPGLMQYLEQGEDVTFSQPADVGGSYEVFQYRTLLQIAAAIRIPYSYLTGDLLKANFSNTRASLVDFRRRVDALQKNVVIHQFCRPVWKMVLDRAALGNELTLPGYRTEPHRFCTIKWLPPRSEWVDPAKDVEAEIRQINAGLKSRGQAISERGQDAAQVDAEIRADRDREEALGLTFPENAMPARAAPVAPPDPDDDGNDTEGQE